MRLAAAVEQVNVLLDTLHILVTHELADVAHVTLECTPGGMPMCFGQRQTQLVGQLQLGQLIGFEGDQALAQILQGIHFTKMQPCLLPK